MKMQLYMALISNCCDMYIFHVHVSYNGKIVISTTKHWNENMFVNKYKWKRGVMVFNTTFINISVTSWRLVLLLEETRISGENHRPAAKFE